MDKQEHLRYLKQKHSELSRQFLLELNEGKSIQLLKDISTVINTLLQEIEALENTGNQNKTSDNN